MTYGSDMYIYFPTSYITNHEVIQIDIGLDVNLPNEDIRFKLDSDNKHSFSNTRFLREHTISDLIFYDYNTQEIIPLDKISLYIAIKKRELQFNGTDMIDSFSMVDTEEELFESNLLLFVPTDVDYIVLHEESINHEISQFDLHKEIDLQAISIAISDSAYQKKYACMATTNFYQIYTSYIDHDHIITDSDRILYENEILQFNTRNTEYIVVQGDAIDLPTFRGKPDASRIRVYVNGLLQSTKNYTITFQDNLYGGGVTIMGINLPNGKAIIEYIGFDEELLYDGPLQDLKKSEDDIIYLEDFLDTPFDPEVFRIFVDGYRIADDRIKIIGQSDMIIIQDTENRFTSTSSIMIYKQAMDREPYDYNEDTAFLTKVVKSDDTFRSYMINKYTR